MSAWTALLEGTRTVFSAPGFALFADLLTGWVCAPGRRTITAMIAVADPAGRRAHDAYHRFVRDGAWAMSGLWRVLAVQAVSRFAPAGVLALDCDDTLFHRAGPKVNGAGVFRDAVRSTAARVVYALGAEPGRAHPAGNPAVGWVPDHAEGVSEGLCKEVGSGALATTRTTPAWTLPN